MLPLAILHNLPYELRDIGQLVGWNPELTGYVLGGTLIMMLFIVAAMYAGATAAIYISLFLSGMLILVGWFPWWLGLFLIIWGAVFIVYWRPRDFS